MCICVCVCILVYSDFISHYLLKEAEPPLSVEHWILCNWIVGIILSVTC